MKTFLKISALVFALMFVFAGCADKNVNQNIIEYETIGEVQTMPVVTDSSEPQTLPVPTKPAVPEKLEITEFIVPEGYEREEVTIDENADRDRVKFTMENGAYFIVELYPEYAPVTCKNFLKLVNEGYYDGLTFHRVLPGFMAQGGDPTRSGREDKADEIYGEFYINGHIKNTISHQRGVISMARTGVYDSASSQFFICYDDCSYSLDGAYAAFGIVTEGMEVVDSFLEVKRVLGYDDAISEPVTPIVIAKAEVIK